MYLYNALVAEEIVIYIALIATLFIKKTISTFKISSKLIFNYKSQNKFKTL